MIPTAQTIHDAISLAMRDLHAAGWRDEDALRLVRSTLATAQGSLIGRGSSNARDVERLVLEASHRLDVQARRSFARREAA